MNYTQWLVNRFPQLNKVSSAKTFAVITQARKQTKTLRILISMLSYLVGGLLIVMGFPTIEQQGHLLAYLAAIIGVVVLFIVLSKTEQRLTEMVMKQALLKRMAASDLVS
ncbi:hypothetical protein [Shewanella waksmanii]|uniref:hypothetical protein n=1 Tax=Shewanella waksmanii TaxID=213783 RepID=UPI003736142C